MRCLNGSGTIRQTGVLTEGFSRRDWLHLSVREICFMNVSYRTSVCGFSTHLVKLIEAGVDLSICLY